MKLSTASVFLSIFVATFVSGGPIIRRHKTVQMSPAVGDAVGALYCAHPVYHSLPVLMQCVVITNEQSGNFVVASDIGSDGTVTLRQAVSTGGLGLHGNEGGVDGPDGLFTQGAIKTSAASNMLATVNVGINSMIFSE